MRSLVSAQSPVHISFDRYDAWLVARVSGDLDLATAGTLTEACEHHPDEPLAMDLAGVGFIDSSGVQALLDLRHRSGRTVLLSPSGVVRRILTLAELTEQFEIVDSATDLVATPS